MPAVFGQKWNSPRGPVEISAKYHDIVQNMYVIEIKDQGGKIEGIATHTFPAEQPITE